MYESDGERSAIRRRYLLAPQDQTNNTATCHFWLKKKPSVTSIFAYRFCESVLARMTTLDKFRLQDRPGCLFPDPTLAKCRETGTTAKTSGSSTPNIARRARST